MVPDVFECPNQGTEEDGGLKRMKETLTRDHLV